MVPALLQQANHAFTTGTVSLNDVPGEMCIRDRNATAARPTRAARQLLHTQHLRQCCGPQRTDVADHLTGAPVFGQDKGHRINTEGG